MVNLPLLQNQMEKAESYVYTIGQIRTQLAEQLGQIATLIEQDLAVPGTIMEAWRKGTAGIRSKASGERILGLCCL